MSASTASESTQTIRVRNTTGRPQELWLEPIGDKVVLDPNVLYEVSATNALDEIDFSADGFTIYGWVIHVAAIDDDGSIQVVWSTPS